MENKMEKTKQGIHEVLTALTEAVMSDEKLGEGEIRAIYKKLKGVVKDIEEIEKIDIFIPKLPNGNEFNGFPRILFALICEKYSRNEFFTVNDMVLLTGASRSQIKADLERLELLGFIRYIDGKTGGHNTRFYKYKPINLVN